MKDKQLGLNEAADESEALVDKYADERNKDIDDIFGDDDDGDESGDDIDDEGNDSDDSYDDGHDDDSGDDNDDDEDDGSDDSDDTDDSDDDEDDEDEEDDSDDDDDESDYDEDDSDDDEDDEDEDEDPRNVTTLRKQLKKAGKKNKELQTEVAENLITIQKLKDENEQHRERINQFDLAQTDLKQHPDVKPLVANLVRRRDSAAARYIEDESAQQNFVTQYEDLVDRFREAESQEKPAEMRRMHSELKKTIYESYSEDNTQRLLDVIEAGHEEREKIFDKMDYLSDKLKSKTLAVGAEKHEESVKKYRDMVKPLGILDEELIESSPFSLESVVAKKIASNEDVKDKANSLKKKFEVALFGPAPLTQDQIDNLEITAATKGMTVEEFQKRREKKASADREDLIKMAFYALLNSDPDEVEVKEKLYAEYLAKETKKKLEKNVRKKAKDRKVKKKVAKKSKKDDRPAWEKIYDDE